MRPYSKPIVALIIVALLWNVAFFGIASLFGGPTKAIIKEELTSQYKSDVETAFLALMSDYELDHSQYEADLVKYNVDSETYKAYMDQFEQRLAEYESSFSTATAEYESQVEVYKKSVSDRDEAYKTAYDKAEIAILKQGVLFSVRSTYNSNYNNHVGNDWRISRSVNGVSVSSGDSIVLSLGGRVTVKSVCVEDDSIPDVGSNSGSHTLIRNDFKDGFTLQHDVTVRENRGRYSGNTAGFTFKYEFSPMPYTVVVDEAKLPVIMEVPIPPAYDPPIAEMTPPINPVEPTRPTISDVDVMYPALDNIIITPVDVYKRNAVAFACVLVVLVIALISVVRIAKNIKKINTIQRAEKRSRQIEQDRIDFFSPEMTPKLPYIVPTRQKWSCEEEKRINYIFMDYLHRRNLLAAALHHRDFLADKRKAPYLQYNETLNLELNNLYDKAQEQVNEASLLIAQTSKSLWQSQLPEYDKLCKSFPFTRAPFVKKSAVKELDEFFSQSNVALLKSKANTFIFTPYYILEYLATELRFLVIPYTGFDANLKPGIKTLSNCPTGADIVSTTWQHTTKNGHPDRRYSYNPAIYQIFDGKVYFHIGQTVIASPATNRAQGTRFIEEIIVYRNAVSKISAEVLTKTCHFSPPVMQYDPPQFLCGRNSIDFGQQS